MTTAPLVRREHDRGVTVLTLDSPEHRNALSARLVEELTLALEDARADPAARAVLLTHTGDTFSAGADLREAGAGTAEGPRRLVALLRATADSPKPVVALVRGHARAAWSRAGGRLRHRRGGPRGHLRLHRGQDRARPAVISLPVLARVDPRAVSRYFLTGETFGPEEAVRIGLVTAPLDALESILDGLRAASPQGLAESKALTAGCLRTALATRGEELSTTAARLFASAEAAEGIRAFLERRAPSWTS